MHKTALLLEKTDDRISLRVLEDGAQSWLLDSEIRQLSDRTIENRRIFLNKTLWFFREFGHDYIGQQELKQFLAYVAGGDKSNKNRWGHPYKGQKIRPRTVATYFTNLYTFFSYLVSEEMIESSPVGKIKPPIARQDQIQPFTPQQVDALLKAAKRSRHWKRDEAIVLFLLDTGVRASELCNLRIPDLDMPGRRCRVLGKGNKYRSVFFGKTTAKALWQYFREEARDDDSLVFLSDRGTKSGEGLTRSGLRQLIERLGKVASIQSARCSPHTFRHTFAVEFLRGGGNVFSLKELLGHTSLTICNRYIALAQADLERQHRQYSPADRLRKSRQ
ncbi:MAG: tyrosine-type recombinase/integrase [Armatimonadetes bacterium]|nr:tyrosine-type recombinase/integrase [Armatimonadota bacterium]